jgi:hypothetical protein
MTDAARAKVETYKVAHGTKINDHALETLLDDFLADQTAALRAALNETTSDIANAVGQLEDSHIDHYHAERILQRRLRTLLTTPEGQRAGAKTEILIGQQRQGITALHGLVETVELMARGLLPNTDVLPREQWSTNLRQTETALQDALRKADEIRNYLVEP